MRKNDVAERILSVRAVDSIPVVGEEQTIPESMVDNVPEVTVTISDGDVGGDGTDINLPIEKMQLESEVPEAEVSVLASDAVVVSESPLGFVITPRHGGGDEGGIAYSTASLLFELESTYVQAAIECGFRDYVAERVVELALKLEAEKEKESNEDADGMNQNQNPNPEVAVDGEGVEKEEVVIKDKIYIHGCKNDDLYHRESFLSIVLDLLSSIGSNIVDIDSHAHVCFHNGMLYTEYCENSCIENV